MIPVSILAGEAGKGFVQDYLNDLVADFPFADDASKQNLFGLLLTPIVRPAITGNVPIHLAEAALERTGKTKLLENVVGGTLLGRPMPAMQLGGTEEEIEKRITSLLLAGHSMIHLDNIGKRLDSPSLSSLVTARFWTGRILGFSRTVTLPNEVTIVASGNNVTASAELAKRIVLIRLQPRDDHPELRTDFRHADLPAFIEETRQRTLGLLVAMVEAWKAARQPRSKRVLGGFESWARIVGGVLQYFGFDRWLSNTNDWLRRAAPDAVDIETLVTRWAEAILVGQEKTAGELLKAIKIDDLFPYVFERPEKGQPAALAKVLRKLVDRPVGQFVVRSRSFGAGTRYRLEPAHVSSEGSEGSEGTGQPGGVGGDAIPPAPRNQPQAQPRHPGVRPESPSLPSQPPLGSENAGEWGAPHDGQGPSLPSLPSLPGLPESDPDDFEEGYL